MVHETTLTFSEIRDSWVSAFRDNDTSIFSRMANRDVFLGQSQAYRHSAGFYGSTGAEMLEYLREGFTLPGLDDISATVAPVRKRSRPRYNDCEGDFRYDLFLTGDENHFVQWSNRESIPGITVEFETGFSSFVPASVIAEYMAWICSALIAIEASGIDSAIYVANEGHRITRNDSDSVRYRMEIKREGERNDFQSWSALFSPGAYRILGFFAITVATDRLGFSTDSGMGKPISKGWGVRWDSEKRTLVISHDGQGRDFPESFMTDQLKSALDAAKN